MRVSFLYYEDCPSYDLALERLREVMDEEGIPGEVEVVKVETEEQARELRFVGSPTIRVDGQDIDPPERPSLRSNLPRLPSGGRPYLPTAFQRYDPAGFQVSSEEPAFLTVGRIERW